MHRLGSDIERSAPGRSDKKLFLRFHLGGQVYLLDATEIVRVLPLREAKRLPGTPDWVVGLIDFMSQPVPVIDISAMATGSRARLLTSTRLVLVRYRRPPVDALLGLVVEQATDTIYCRPADFLPSGVDNADAPFLGPVYRDEEGGYAQWVGVRELLSANVQALLFPDGQPVRPEGVLDS